jgi:hypothetical protein
LATPCAAAQEGLERFALHIGDGAIEGEEVVGEQALLELAGGVIARGHADAHGLRVVLDGVERAQPSQVRPGPLKCSTSLEWATSIRPS